MILDLTLEEDKKTKKILNEQAPWDPPQAVKDRTAEVMRDFQLANVIRNKPYAEFNFNSLLERITLDQTSWNQYPGSPSRDPLESWKSLAFRPIVRNKIISIAAHLTTAAIYPKIYAQNEDEQEDRDAATVMEDLLEWTCDQSKYVKTFLYSVISAMVNPAAFIQTEYREIYRNIKEIQPDGSWKEKRILDEQLSGFRDTMVPPDELWISNIYVHDIQEQPYLIWRRVINYSTARQKYDGVENFKYVKPGIQFIYSNLYNLFYQAWDESLRQELVEEVIYYNRLGDLELRFVNGILMDDPDQPNKRNDKMYPFVKGGYELFDDGRFFYYMSAAFKMANDEAIVNTAYRMLVDGTYLQMMPPAVVFGNESIGTSVIAPGAITTIDNSTNPNASFQTINTNNNLSAGMELINKVEESIGESSVDLSGLGSARMTAYESNLLQMNAKTLLGLFAQMISFMVEDYGRLRVGDILQHMTVGDVSDTITGPDMLKFKSFLLPNKTIDGKTKTRKISFDLNMPTGKITKSDLLAKSQEIATKQREMGDNVQLYLVNPQMFRQLKFKVQMMSEAVNPKSDALMKAMNLEEYDRAIQNPLIAQNPKNLEAVTRDLLFASYDRTKDDPEIYLAPPAQQGGPGGGVPGAQPGSNQDQQAVMQAAQGALQNPTPTAPSAGRASLVAGIQPASTAQIAKARG